MNNLGHGIFRRPQFSPNMAYGMSPGTSTTPQGQFKPPGATPQGKFKPPTNPVVPEADFKPPGPADMGVTPSIPNLGAKPWKPSIPPIPATPWTPNIPDMLPPGGDVPQFLPGWKENAGPASWRVGGGGLQTGETRPWESSGMIEHGQTLNPAWQDPNNKIVPLPPPPGPADMGVHDPSTDRPDLPDMLKPSWDGNKPGSGQGKKKPGGMVVPQNNMGKV